MPHREFFSDDVYERLEYWDFFVSARRNVYDDSPPEEVHDLVEYQEFFDFQLTLRASWCRDVSYIIGTALTPEQRRVHEEALLRAYVRALQEAGGTPPTIEEARRLYACGMAWGLVIGWLICPPNNYGPAVLSANVSRLVAACVDLRTFDLLRERAPGRAASR